MNSKGSVALALTILFVIISSVLLGFVVGALTDPKRKHTDLRAAANEQPVKAVIESSDTCERTLRWYTIDLLCY